MKLVSITKSDRDGKKYKAVFEDPKKTTHFGQSGADDYTITKNKEQRDRYRERHKKDLKTNDPSRAGYLSYHILWGDSTSLRKNIEDYKRRFKL
jgi:ppGpp synthetase/RelA/SpoT-type nucleotidyltranferase